MEIKPTASFKRESIKAVFGIILFIIGYLLIFLIAMGVSAGAISAGLLLIITMGHLVVILAGVGLVAVGGFILVFFLKFFFAGNKHSLDGLIEITAEDEPELFQMVSELATEVGTKFPKHVYLSADVNASVFFNSTFWSMIFPVRKNLIIGMGLVNAVTKAELKAILAHEFGHFSQKTMRVGSFVYNLNNIIHNQLNENDTLKKVMEDWASISGILAIFTELAFAIIRGIQWCLIQLYGLLNKPYKSLSREMEFHADEIAAHVTGYEALNSSLLRLDFANSAFAMAVNGYESLVEENLKSANIYAEQQFFMTYLAEKFEIPIEDGLPQISAEIYRKFDKSKLVIKDQWASHPTTEHRVERLKATELSQPHHSSAFASTLFQDIEKVQKKLTDVLFQGVSFKVEPRLIGIGEIKERFHKELAKNALPEIYNEYYTQYNPKNFDLPATLPPFPGEILPALFSDEFVEKINSLQALREDIEIINQIKNGQIDIRTFDYAGKKYSRKEADGLLTTLNKELNDELDLLLENDKAIYAYFAHKEPAGSTLLRDYYQEYFDQLVQSQADGELQVLILQRLTFIQTYNSNSQIEFNFKKVKKLEDKIKARMPVLLESPLIQDNITPEMRSALTKYLAYDLHYYKMESYIEENLQTLFIAIESFYLLSLHLTAALKRRLLEYQAGLVATAAPTPSE